MPTITLIGPAGQTITLTPPDAATPDEIQGVVDQVIASHGISREQRLEMLAEPPGPAAPGFFEKLGSELTAAGEEAGQALGRPGMRSLPLIASPTEVEQAVHVDPGLLGPAGRALNAPFMAAGAGAGRAVLGATGSPAAATAADIAAQVGSGALAGAVGRGLVRGAQRILPRLPGASGALLEQQMVEARRLPAQYAPTTPSETLYSIADSLNPQVTDLPRLQETAKAIAAQEERLAKAGLANRGTQRIAERISRTLERGPERVLTAEVQPSAANQYVQAPSSAYGITEARLQGDIPTFSFQEVRDWLRRLGQRIDDLRDPMRRSTGSGEQLGAAKKMYASLLSDLEQSAEDAVGPAAEALKAANLAAKREFASKELGDIIESGIKRVQGSNLPENVNFGTILNNLKKEVRKNELFVQAFTEGELDAIEGALEQARKLPVAAPPRGASVGSSLQARRVGYGGALGAMIGGYTGGWQGSVVGGTIGSFGGLALSNAISSALMSETGRRFLVSAVRANPGMLLSAEGVAMLSAAARAGAEQQ